MPATVARPVRDHHLSDFLLISLTFGSGAVDAISYLGLGRVFTANMTGNIVLLGLAIGSASRSEAVRAAVSLTAFILGVLAGSRLAYAAPDKDARPWPPGVRRVLAIEVAAQAAFLGCWLAASGRPGHALEAVLVGFSGFAMGLQTGAVSALGVAGVSTTYVTGTLTYLLTDLVTARSSTRDWVRRTLVLVGLLAGATCGGVLIIDARTVAPVLPLAVTLLVAALALYALPAARTRPEAAG